MILTPWEIGGIVVVVLLLMAFVVPWVVSKHLPVNTYLTLSEDGINLLKNLIEPMLPPADQKVMDLIAKYAEIAVKYAEQLYISGQLPADQRKQAAINFIINAAKDAGVTLTATQLQFAEAVIEAVVYLLPDTHPIAPSASGTGNIVFNKNF